MRTVTKRTREGWTLLTPVERYRGRCGALWQHVSGWHIEHCGHPTANWPYFLWHSSRQLNVMSHNGMGFTHLKETQLMVEAISRGELAITTGGCVPGIARIPTRTALGSEVTARPDSAFGWMQGVWSKDGLAA